MSKMLVRSWLRSDCCQLWLFYVCNVRAHRPPVNSYVKNPCMTNDFMEAYVFVLVQWNINFRTCLFAALQGIVKFEFRNGRTIKKNVYWPPASLRKKTFLCELCTILSLLLPVILQYNDLYFCLHKVLSLQVELLNNQVISATWVIY